MCHDIRFMVCTWAQYIGPKCIGNEKYRVKYLSGQNELAEKTYQRTKCVIRQNVPAEKCISRKHIGKHESEKLLRGDAGLSSLQKLG
jgi:hypothetical protein